MCCFLSLLSPFFLISLCQGQEEQGKPLPGGKSKRWDACIGFPSLAFPFGERNDSNYCRPSFEMDCLLALWDLLLLASLVTYKVWSLDLYLKKLPCITVYILTQNSIKHPCSTRDLGLRLLLFFSLSLFLADSPEREGQLCNPGNISLFPSFTFLCRLRTTRFRSNRRQEEKGTTQDEMVGWHDRHNGHESE